MKRAAFIGKQRHVMKKEDVEKEISALVGSRVSVRSEIRKGRSRAVVVLGEWEYEGEAASIDFAYRALLMKIREEARKGMLT